MRVKHERPNPFFSLLFCRRQFHVCVTTEQTLSCGVVDFQFHKQGPEWDHELSGRVWKRQICHLGAMWEKGDTLVKGTEEPLLSSCPFFAADLTCYPETSFAYACCPRRWNVD
jgi:hypothetical protein